jgi:hypothetical protein
MYNNTVSFYKGIEKRNSKVMANPGEESWFFFPKSYGAGWAGGAAFRVANYLSYCSGRMAENVCLIMARHSDSTNTALMIAYIFGAYAFFGGACQIYRIKRAIAESRGGCEMSEKKLKLLSWQYQDSEDPAVREMAKNCCKASTDSAMRGGARMNVTHHISKSMEESDVFMHLGLLTEKIEESEDNMLRKLQTVLMYWMPQYLYVYYFLALFYTPFSIFWRVVMRLMNKGEKGSFEESLEVAPVKGNHSREDHQGRMSKFHRKAYFKNAVASMKKYKWVGDIPSSWLKKAAYLVFWLMIGPVSGLTHTYTFDCDDTLCRRAIDIDEEIRGGEGTQLMIDLFNPKKGVVDGYLQFDIIEMKVTTMGSYEWSIPQFSSPRTCTCFKDSDDCDKDCSYPWTMSPKCDYGEEFIDDCKSVYAVATGPWTYSSQIEYDGNDGYCAGWTSIEPQYSLGAFRAFSLAESVTTVKMRVTLTIDDTEESWEVVSTLHNEVMKFGEDGELQMTLPEQEFYMKNDRVVCSFGAGERTTMLSECVKDAPGFSVRTNMIKTRGEDTFSAWTSNKPSSKMTGSWDEASDTYCGYTFDANNRLQPSLGDMKALGTDIDEMGCLSEVSISPSEFGNEFGYCVDTVSTTREECLASVQGGYGDLAWKSGREYHPRTINITRVFCTDLALALRAGMSTEYDAEVERNYLTRSDLKIESSGCYGRVNGVNLTITTEKPGTLMMVSGSLIVPGSVYISQTITIQASALLHLEAYDFMIRDDKEVSLDNINEECETVSSGGDSVAGSAGGTADGTDNKWWIIVVCVAAGLIFLLIMVLVIVCLCNKRRETVSWVEKSK